MLKEFTLLYVEDDKSMQEYMATLLEDEVKKLYRAYDGNEGLLLFEEKKPDIIISDINMPELNGLDMSRKIKRINPEQIIIVLSSLNDIQVIKDSIDINIDGYINKPIMDIEEFLSQINSKATILKYKILKKKEDKLEILLNVIQEMTHHWRQPLNVISLLSSGYLCKCENNIPITIDDTKNFEIILETVNKLASLLDDMENVTLENYDVEKLSELIKISNPIYETRNKNEA